jgi:hypothetical protein
MTPREREREREREKYPLAGYPRCRICRREIRGWASHHRAEHELAVHLGALDHEERARAQRALQQIPLSDVQVSLLSHAVRMGRPFGVESGYDRHSLIRMERRGWFRAVEGRDLVRWELLYLGHLVWDAHRRRREALRQRPRS